ncbi:MAG TPA: HlyD family efflux transporter periplasmic adaptor subunit [Bacteroidales bacterium]|nr:HlyD family efflux transporter periplasmic adaptor subunit [Bacteroidales bacterium]
MRTLLLSFSSLLLLYACSNNDDKADAYGNFEAVETIVGSEGQGKLLKFIPEEGMVLKEGELVGVVDTTSLWLKKQQLIAMKKAAEAKLIQINAQIDVQKTQRETVLKEKNRIESLVKDKAAPEKQLDDINGQYKLIESQIVSIKSQNQSVAGEIESLVQQIKQVEDQISRSYITNPIDGTVLEKYIEPSEIVTIGKNLYKIANLGTIKLKVYVTGALLPRIKIGQKVIVKIDADSESNQALQGTISWISSQAEFTPKIIQTKEERVKQVYAVKVDVVNDGRIKIGMPGEILIDITNANTK